MQKDFEQWMGVMIRHKHRCCLTLKHTNEFFSNTSMYSTKVGIKLTVVVTATSNEMREKKGARDRAIRSIRHKCAEVREERVIISERIAMTPLACKLKIVNCTFRRGRVRRGGRKNRR